MKAILVKEDRRLVWSDIPTPKVLPEQVLIRVEYAAVRDVWGNVSCGEIRPAIFRVLPITEAEAAHALLYDGKSAGKVVLHVAG